MPNNGPVNGRDDPIITYENIVSRLTPEQLKSLYAAVSNAISIKSEPIDPDDIADEEHNNLGAEHTDSEDSLDSIYQGPAATDLLQRWQGFRTTYVNEEQPIPGLGLEGLPSTSRISDDVLCSVPSTSGANGNSQESDSLGPNVRICTETRPVIWTDCDTPWNDVVIVGAVTNNEEGGEEMEIKPVTDTPPRNVEDEEEDYDLKMEDEDDEEVVLDDDVVEADDDIVITAEAFTQALSSEALEYLIKAEFVPPTLSSFAQVKPSKAAKKTAKREAAHEQPPRLHTQSSVDPALLRPPSPVFFTAMRMPEPVEPPDSARIRLNRYADLVGPVIFDLYLENQPDLDAWPEPQPAPGTSNADVDFDSSSLHGAHDSSGDQETLAGPSTASFPEISVAHIPSIFLERVRSDVPIDLVAPTVEDAVSGVRRLMRKRMHRCIYCKNRFVERDIIERHVRERHPIMYDKYMERKAKQEERERLEYLEKLAFFEQVETRRNERLAWQYERAFEINEKREEEGLPELPMEKLFPQRPKRKRPATPPPGEDQEDVRQLESMDPEERLRTVLERHRNKRVKFKKKICPQCPFCDKRYKNDTALRRHVAHKHPECIHFVQCNRCYKCVKNHDELLTHDCDLTWICLECQPIRNLITAQRLYDHKNKFHRGERSGFMCLECGKKFQTPRKLRYHKTMDHVHSRTFKCHFCDEYFASEEGVSLHERVHTGKVKFECKICDFVATRYISLTDHTREEHGYLCMTCGEKLIGWKELKEHTLENHEGYLCVDSQTVFLVSSRMWILYKGE